MIKITGLDKFYNKNKSNELHVLKNINIDLPQRGMVAVFGKSGCGKTTFLNMIGGLDNSDKGQVEIEGEAVSSSNDTVRNKYIGHIFQNYCLNPSETCFDNVANALKLCGIKDKDVIEKRVLSALKNVGMEKYRKRTPDTLSGGQMQRIAIARAIVKNPPILLADEPTGNLDAENTIMIMDLLKEISRDHLVVLVTHEQKLVDYYCDKVIEFKDGEIVNIRDNENVDGYNGKPKNNIYLGELQKNELSNSFVNVDFYGDPSQKPIDIKIISHEGKIYLKIAKDEGVHVIDDSSEIKLIDGVFEQKSKSMIGERHIDMSELPPIEGKKFGKLFSFKDGLVAGFKNNFSKKKKRKKLLYLCMTAFAVSVVFSCAFFGVALKSYSEIKSKINDNVFYVYAHDTEVTDKLYSSIGLNGIEDISLSFSFPPDGNSFSISKIKFESSANNNGFMEEMTSYQVIYLNTDSISENTKFYGKVTDLKDNEMVISTFLADKIIKDSSVEYISSYDNVLNLRDSNGNVIVGIVKSDKSEVYFSKIALAKQNIERYSCYPVVIDEENRTDISKNEVILYTYDNPFEYSRGDLFKINGKEFTVNRVVTNTTYLEWCKMMGYDIETDKKSYFTKMVKKDFPNLTEDSQAYLNYLDEYKSKYYFQFYDDFYRYIDDYMTDMSKINSDYNFWLYSAKNIDHAKYLFIETIEKDEYYSAVLYKEKYGSYPPKNYLDSNKSELITIEDLEKALSVYIGEYESYNWAGYNSFFVVLDKEDYITVSNTHGESSVFETKYNFYRSREKSSKNSAEATFSFWLSNISYYKIVSSDKKATLSLIEELKTIIPEEIGDEWYSFKSIFTPDDIYENTASEVKSDITSNLISMVVFMILVSICIFLIMRSSIMLRIREIGIYRAVGMSSKNMIMKFLAESVALTTLSIMPGFIISSMLIKIWTSQSILVEDIFYFTLPMAAFLLIFIYFICILSGILPIVILLRKTPSDILSKYDI